MKTKKLTKTEINDCLWFRFGKLYIRLRDTNKHGIGYCISSGSELYWTEAQSGHFIPNGSCKYLTWNEDNVHIQSMRDNVLKHGNLIRYRPALIAKIGKEKVERMESMKNETKQRKERELIEMIQKYRELALARMLLKSNKVQNEILQYVKSYGKKKRETLYKD